MVKPPNIRHSKSRKEPMTIELGPDEVSRIEASTPADSAPETEQAAAHTTSTEMPAREAQAETEAPVDQRAANEDSTPAEAVARADEYAGSAPGRADQPAEQETASYIGSEWPPEPDAADTPHGEERVSHAFGRDPGTPPRSASTRVGGEEEPIRAPQPPERRTVLPAIAAGVLGGLIALAAAGGLQL